MRWHRIELSDDSMVAELPRGRSHYVRAVLDEHLARCYEALRVLRESRTDDEVIDLLDAGSVPARRMAETDLVSLDDHTMALLSLLWWEMEAAELESRELLALLSRELPA